MTERTNYPIPCPCCGMPTLSESGGYEICPICNWEDDPVQSSDVSFEGGANELSLAQARAKWRLHTLDRSRDHKH
ncbi:CPCC family cysteine-rich protein [Burkholderia pyrrocinia]